MDGAPRQPERNDPDASGTRAGERRASESVAEVVDQHTELREILSQIEETTDLRLMSGLLERLSALLQKHFALEEAEEGLHRVIGRTRPGTAARLSAEHREILTAVRALGERVRTDRSLAFAAVEAEIGAVLSQLRDHDACGTVLLRDAVTVEGASPRAPARSSALEANLRRTAVDVVIPEEQRVLLDVTASHYGIHEETRKLLREINHRYVGWPQTLEELHRRAMSDFAHYQQHPEAIGVFCSLYARAAEEAVPPEVRKSAIRYLLRYLEKVAASSESHPANLAPLLGGLRRLAGLFERNPRRAVSSSGQLKRVTHTLLDATGGFPCAALECSVALSLESLRRVTEHWLDREDPAEWYRERARTGPEAPLPDAVVAISHARLAACRDELRRLAGREVAGAPPEAEAAEALRSRARALFALPDNAQIERGYLEAAAALESEGAGSWESRLERIHWLTRVLASGALAAVHESALREISRCYADVLREADRTPLEQCVCETFETLRRGELTGSQTALNLIKTIGHEVLATGDSDWAELVIDEILACDFPHPDFSGFTDEWGVRVNPAHLAALRTYLSLIEAHPQRAGRLFAALVVHLKVGGVFIADTDLFQKDVSRLLNSDIAAYPVYHHVKQLLKLFPVYFSDIGAEGEIRDDSTRIDEIGGRKDPLCHFLRKQCHVESNPLLLPFIEAIARFWATGDPAPLRAYVPASLYEQLDVESDSYRRMHEVFTDLVGPGESLDTFLDLEPQALAQRLLERTGRADPVDREKVELLLRLRRLIAHKYRLDHADLLDRLRAFHHIDAGQVDALQQALEAEHHEAALEVLLGILDHLQDMILSEKQTRAIEDIYHKRHVAVGIPSMYGHYREQKFEAMGLTFRVESFANVLFERMVSGHALPYVTKTSLQKVVTWLRLMLRALRIDGCRGMGPATGIDMLEHALGAQGITVDQYVNIFQFISNSIENLIRVRFLDVYGPVLDRFGGRMLERGVLAADPEADPRETVLKISETFLRDLIAQSFGLQLMDNLVGNVLRTLIDEREKLDRDTLNLLMSYDADRCIVRIDQHASPHDAIIYLGYKGYMIKRLAQSGFPVPEGFILTTETFRCAPAIRAYEGLRRENASRIRREVARLERLTGRRFGDPRNPLLLSVRSGAAISMPGMLDTFLNVGINTEIAEGFAVRSGSAWAAWDAYRRFLQFWGMSRGIARDRFDALMREAKEEFLVAKKAQMPPEKMKKLAFRYRKLLAAHGVEVLDDPYAQLDACAELVLRSWDSEKARIYRRELQIADEWGTAVIVQNMVYGNLHARSGTGVTLTRPPWQAAETVELHGDFIIQGQGDDVVSGLVATFPITERQRRRESKDAALSLEKDFPAVYLALERHARALIYTHEMHHQEIEFTFESDEPEDLYLLQTRDIVLSRESSGSTFVPTEKLERSRVATGIGVGSGAVSGRVAHSADDIAALRKRFPGDSIMLLRPNTVPDDIELLLNADGLLTATGGATSHAAVVAQRLGRPCVVGCRLLEVHEERGRSDLAGHPIATGDFLSINGGDGSVYLGEHPTTVIRLKGLV